MPADCKQSLNNAGLGTDANSLSFHLRGEQQQAQQQRQSAEYTGRGSVEATAETSDDETTGATSAGIMAPRNARSDNNGIDINV